MRLDSPAGIVLKTDDKLLRVPTVSPPLRLLVRSQVVVLPWKKETHCEAPYFMQAMCQCRRACNTLRS